MNENEIRGLIKKSISKMKAPFSSVNVKISKLMYYNEGDIVSLSFSASTNHLTPKVKNIYEIELKYYPRSFLSATFETRDKIENRVCNSIRLILGGLLKVEPEDIKFNFNVGVN
jgi:hypothetical protein